MTSSPARRLSTDFDQWHRRILGYPAVIPRTDREKLGVLARAYSEKFARELLAAYFSSTDPFITRVGYSVGRFMTQVPQLLRHAARAQATAPLDRHPVMEALSQKISRFNFYKFINPARVIDLGDTVILELPAIDAQWVIKHYATAIAAVEQELWIRVTIREAES